MDERSPALTVLPDGPVAGAVRKGEVKARYYNPADLFARIQVVSPADEQVRPEDVARMTGSAETAFVGSGWMYRARPSRPLGLRSALHSEVERLVPSVAAFRPHAIRGYGAQIAGWLAVQVARRIGVPSVISLHTDYDRDVRQLLLADLRLRPFLAHLVLGLLVEPETVRLADHVICAYEFPVRYARRHGARSISVIYNRVDTERFRPPEVPPDGPFTVLCVSRLDPDKDQSALIRAMARVDGRLRIIGDGLLRPRLLALARDLGIEDRVELIPALPHAGIQAEYRRSHVFAAAYRVGGVSIPMLEAMACALPLVVSRSRWERSREVADGVGIVVEPDATAFAAALERLRQDSALRARLGAAGRERALAMSGREMERREADLYRRLIATG